MRSHSRLQLNVLSLGGAAQRSCARRLICTLRGNKLDRRWFPVVPDPLLSDCLIIARGAQMMSTLVELLRRHYSIRSSTTMNKSHSLL